MKIRNAMITVGMTSLALLSVWLYFGAPTSAQQLSLNRRIAAVITSKPISIDLRDLNPDDWETVCDSHAYDGPMYLKKYNRTYDPVAPPHDGVWGLIFIRSDGTFTDAVGSCRYPGVKLDVNGCREARSIKLLLKNSQDGACPVYQAP
ncbi:MAG: hypothetical protein V4454_16830 [Pseudomonadota bacterium]